MIDRFDILLDDDLDIQIENKDLVLGESNQQHAELIVHTLPGELKEYPLTGFGIVKRLKKVNYSPKQFTRDLKVELENDRFTDPEISFTEDGQLEIDV